MKKIFLFVFLHCLNNSLFSQSDTNIIFLIGDGMGVPQISASFYSSDSPLQFEKFKNIGLIKTHSSKEKITDSAAGATAFATGKKTYNGAVSVDDKGKHLETIVEKLEKKGYQTGIISTSSVTHATPACFYAHSPSRQKEYEIAKFMPKSGVDFFAGGGRKFFKNASLLQELKAQNYIVSQEESYDFDASDPQYKYGFLLAEEGMKSMQKGRKSFLSESFDAATKYFSLSKKPFFLMLESAQIDWGGHANNEEYVISETLDFDMVIGQAIDFVNNNPNTLLIVTADHETGGLALTGKEKGKEIDFKFATNGHTATLIPVFAYGKNSEIFRGIYENTDIYFKMLKGIEN